MEKISEAFLSSFFALMMDKIVSYGFTRFFETQKMDPVLLNKLKTLLNKANGVLDDAEHKQLTSPAVKEWLVELRDTAYVADDLLDLIAYEATAAEIESDQRATEANQQWSVFTLRNPFKKPRVDISSSDIPSKMEEIVGILDFLLQQQQTGPLEQREGGKKDAFPAREPTTSLIDESDTFGREKDKEAIIKMLKEDDENGNSIGVIPIVGMGGIGKTTLAQLVYNDSRAQKLFEPRAWICVSDNYDGSRIKKDLLKQLIESVNCDGLPPEQIDWKINESLKDKMFLLVLDDMWNESFGDWDKLQAPLKSGAPGSKIIITTRIKDVASIMRTVKSYELRTLDAAYCWRLFAKRAFNGGSEDLELKAIGEKIVSKCKGLPLAIKMLGDLLRCEREVTEWEAILTSDIWDLSKDEILPALRLSYRYLPSQLKQCFAYCAIFPKDYRMRKEEILQLWMAEGFLVKPKGGRRITELGEKYLQELVSRSFLQEHNDQYYGSCFLMHDLINDLAQQISGEFVIRLDRDNSSEFNVRNRYFSFLILGVDRSKLDSIRRAQFLRTLWFWPTEYIQAEKLISEIVVEVVNDLHCLRVLSLCNFYTMVKLPEPISKLKHLRYLNLARTKVVSLPETVCFLYNLQTLNLYQCDKLVELPAKFGNLINLHFLDIRRTTNLQAMPPRMGNLKDLQTLCKFYVGKQNGSSINELGKLQHLQGQLSIYNLENVEGTQKDILKNKKHLKELELIWSGGIEGNLHENNLLEGLQPHTSIKKLSIHDYGGTKFANWVGHSSYSNIVSLKLYKCKNCFCLPPFEQLSSLEYLSISKFDVLVEVSMKTPLNSLKTLLIEDMKMWQEWIFGKENDPIKCGSLVKLEELTIKNCPELRSISTCGPTHMIFESLSRLIVEGCPILKTSNLLATLNFKQLVVKSKPPNRSLISKNDFDNNPKVILERLPSAMYGLYVRELTTEGLEEMGTALNALEEVTIRESDSCECIPLEVSPVLKSLDVFKCDNLKSLSAYGEPLPHPLMSLASLKIRGCWSLRCFPKGGISAPRLTHLKLSFCSNLKSLPEGMHILLPSLENLSIYNCEELESFPEGGLPVKLQSLEIVNCNDKFVSVLLQWGLQTLDALSDLRLEGYKGDDFDCFPELPSSLTSLYISLFINLKYMNCKGLQHLADLSISRCPNLQSFLQEEGLGSSDSVQKSESIEEVETESRSGGAFHANLQSLQIFKCDKLIGGRRQWGLQRFNALLQLSLRNYEGDDLDSFPEESVLPSTLNSLTIKGFKNLKEINNQGLQHLTSLAQLKINECPNLQWLPEGQDWSKISHISTIEINYRTI